VELWSEELGFLSALHLRKVELGMQAAELPRRNIVHVGGNYPS
jgi:hypothetical protein